MLEKYDVVRPHVDEPAPQQRRPALIVIVPAHMGGFVDPRTCCSEGSFCHWWTAAAPCAPKPAPTHIGQPADAGASDLPLGGNGSVGAVAVMDDEGRDGAVALADHCCLRRSVMRLDEEAAGWGVAKGPAGRPLLQADPPYRGLRDLTRDEAKTLFAEQLHHLGGVGVAERQAA